VRPGQRGPGGLHDGSGDAGARASRAAVRQRLDRTGLSGSPVLGAADDPAARPPVCPWPLPDATGRPVRADRRLRCRRAAARDRVTPWRAGRRCAVVCGLRHDAAVRHRPAARTHGPEHVHGARFPDRAAVDARAPADQARPAVQLARAGMRGRARGPRRSLCRPHRPAAPRRWPAPDGDPGRDRGSGCPCRAPAPIRHAAAHHHPGRAPGLRAPDGVRGQSRPWPGPGAAGDLRARLRLGRRDRWPAHPGSAAGPAEPRPCPGQRGPDVHPGPGVRAVGDRGTVPSPGRCHPPGRRRGCPRRRHASAGSAAPPAPQRAPGKESWS